MLKRNKPLQKIRILSALLVLIALKKLKKFYSNYGSEMNLKRLLTLVLIYQVKNSKIYYHFHSSLKCFVIDSKNFKENWRVIFMVLMNQTILQKLNSFKFYFTIFIKFSVYECKMITFFPFSVLPKFSWSSRCE